MSLKIEIENRIKTLRLAIEQSMHNHNALSGRLAEAQHIFEQIIKLEASGEPVTSESEEELKKKSAENQEIP